MSAAYAGAGTPIMLMVADPMADCIADWNGGPTIVPRSPVSVVPRAKTTVTVEYHSQHFILNLRDIESPFEKGGGIRKYFRCRTWESNYYQRNRHAQKIEWGPQKPGEALQMQGRIQGT